MKKGQKLYQYDERITFRTMKETIQALTIIATDKKMSTNSLLNLIAERYIKREGK